MLRGNRNPYENYLKNRKYKQPINDEFNFFFPDAACDKYLFTGFVP